MSNSSGTIQLKLEGYTYNVEQEAYDDVIRQQKEQEMILNEWRSIKGYEGLYMINSKGNIWSLPRITEIKRADGASHIRRTKGAQRKICTSQNGYLVVALSKNGKQKNQAVHYLVAEAFIPNPSGLKGVKFIDGQIRNIKSDNLEWASW